jgi:endogenous inhibitor of DNA gyrase (YacG/DUF329 family)
MCIWRLNRCQADTGRGDVCAKSGAVVLCRRCKLAAFCSSKCKIKDLGGAWSLELVHVTSCHVTSVSMTLTMVT